MSSYRWELEHKADLEKAKAALKEERFEVPEDEKVSEEGVLYLYAKTINNWKPLKAKVKEQSIEFDYYWMGTETTQVYYDYLMTCGTIIGRLMVYLDAQEETDE